MRQLKNERHSEKEMYATDLDILRELHLREALDEEYCNLLEQMEAKEKGLRIVLDRLEQYGHDHWLYVSDLSLDAKNSLTCDLTLLTMAGMYVFEIHHADGFFELKNDVGYLNNEKMAVHPIQKAKKITARLKRNARKKGVPLSIQGAMVFTNPDTPFMIQDETDGVDIVTLDTLDEYISKIIRTEEEYTGKSMISPTHLRWWARIDRNHPIHKYDIPGEIKARVRKGIHCCHCGSFDIQLGDPYTACNCGMHESLEEAIVRTVCEYGVLNNNKQLEVSALMDFFDHQISEDTLYRYLDKHFTPVY